MDLDNMSQEAISHYAARRATETIFNGLIDEIRRGGPGLAAEAIAAGADGPWSTYTTTLRLDSLTIESTTTGVRVTATGCGDEYTREIIWYPTDAEIREELVGAAQWDATVKGDDYEGPWQLTEGGFDQTITDLIAAFPDVDRETVENRARIIHRDSIQPA